MDRKKSVNVTSIWCIHTGQYSLVWEKKPHLVYSIQRGATLYKEWMKTARSYQPSRSKFLVYYAKRKSMGKMCVSVWARSLEESTPYTSQTWLGVSRATWWSSWNAQRHRFFTSSNAKAILKKTSYTWLRAALVWPSNRRSCNLATENCNRPWS